MLRTHTCGELTKKDAEKKVVLSGWVDSVRPHGKIGFISIRDRYGITQLVLKEKSKEGIEQIKKESVIRATGIVNSRPANLVNKEMPTGEIEVNVSKLEILNQSEPLPIQLDEHIQSTEETRLRYRYLDLRRQAMQHKLITRYKVIKAIRDYLDKNNFLEIETPLLAKSTPEGARDYLVPSRIFPGKFYALPQSPQLFKQLLMIAGYDKYFQIARCLRDEDLRADRQPEFTQLDIEMSFIEEEDIISLIEELVKYIWKEIFGTNLKTPFPRIVYSEAMKKYKTDKPDLRSAEEKKKKSVFKFIWVVDFPLFKYSKEEKRYVAMHHPFTSPKSEADLKDLTKAKSKTYDLVLNGVEIGGGSIRIHNPETQTKVFKVLGISEKEAKEKFGFLLEALSYGGPPHGGIALGLDRFIAMITGDESIREVIAFPKTKDAEDLMLNAPSEIKEEQLKELGIKIIK